MATNILEKFDELFGDEEVLEPQKIELFVQESLKFFEYLREKLQSKDENEQKEALNIAIQLQKKLESFAQKTLSKSGLSPDQLKNFMAAPQNFTPEEWKTLENSEKDIEDYQKELRKNHLKRI
jgi:hypothetical protein